MQDRIKGFSLEYVIETIFCLFEENVRGEFHDVWLFGLPKLSFLESESIYSEFYLKIFGTFAETSICHAKQPKKLDI